MVDSTGIVILKRISMRLSSIGFPILVLAFIATYLSQSRGLAFRSIAFPYALIVILAVLTISDVSITSLKIAKQTSDMQDVSHEKITIRHVILPLALAAFLILFNKFGVFIATAAFLFTTMPLLGYRSARRLVIIVGIVLLVIHVVFIELFYLPLPGRLT